MFIVDLILQFLLICSLATLGVIGALLILFLVY